MVLLQTCAYKVILCNGICRALDLFRTGFSRYVKRYSSRSLCTYNKNEIRLVSHLHIHLWSIFSPCWPINLLHWKTKATSTSKHACSKKCRFRKKYATWRRHVGWPRLTNCMCAEPFNLTNRMSEFRNLVLVGVRN